MTSCNRVAKWDELFQAPLVRKIKVPLIFLETKLRDLQLAHFYSLAWQKTFPDVVKYSVQTLTTVSENIWLFDIKNLSYKPVDYGSLVHFGKKHQSTYLKTL